MSDKIKFYKYDPIDFFKSDMDMINYMKACLDEGGHDLFITAVQGVLRALHIEIKTQVLPQINEIQISPNL